MGRINAVVLVKGNKVNIARTSKVAYHKVELYIVGENGVDVSADCDMENGGKALFEAAGKMEGQKVNAVLDLSFYDKQARFKMVSMSPVK